MELNVKNLQNAVDEAIRSPNLTPGGRDTLNAKGALDKTTWKATWQEAPTQTHAGNTIVAASAYPKHGLILVWKTWFEHSELPVERGY